MGSRKRKWAEEGPVASPQHAPKPGGASTCSSSRGVEGPESRDSINSNSNNNSSESGDAINLWDRQFARDGRYDIRKLVVSIIGPEFVGRAGGSSKSSRLFLLLVIITFFLLFLISL
jgi:hypothetical protein